MVVIVGGIDDPFQMVKALVDDAIEASDEGVNVASAEQRLGTEKTSVMLTRMPLTRWRIAKSDFSEWEAQPRYWGQALPGARRP